MNSWINLDALWKIVVVGLLAGAGLPAVFAIGLRALSLGPRNATVPAGTQGGGATTGGDSMLGGSLLGLLAGGLCFAVVLASIGWGIYFIVSGS
jgi:hypothetical protein